MYSRGVRLFLPVTKIHTYGFADWGSVAFEYLKAFAQTKVPMKAIASTLADLKQEGWRDYTPFFTAPLPGKFVNVVIGSFQRFWTEGVTNIAIVAGKPTTEDLNVLPKYDAVFTPTLDYPHLGGMPRSVVTPYGVPYLVRMLCVPLHGPDICDCLSHS